jgi:peptide methionine sulfoxide reductase MsrB
MNKSSHAMMRTKLAQQVSNTWIGHMFENETYDPYIHHDKENT